MNFAKGLVPGPPQFMGEAGLVGIFQEPRPQNLLYADSSENNGFSDIPMGIVVAPIFAPVSAHDFPFRSEVRSSIAGHSDQNSFLGILGCLGASAMGFSMGASALVIFAPTNAGKSHRRGAEAAEDSEERKRKAASGSSAPAAQGTSAIRHAYDRASWRDHRSIERVQGRN